MESKLVWQLHFAGLLHKCLWYALDVPSLSANVRSVMWGIGYKMYPGRWWQGVLRRFWHKNSLESLLPLKGVLLWVRAGALHGARG